MEDETHQILPRIVTLGIKRLLTSIPLCFFSGSYYNKMIYGTPLESRLL